ncbi:MAG: hypothetical protein KJN76_01690 [Eudoraea sp.]|nr:hypothetical protein [Eudoraea sp.]
MRTYILFAVIFLTAFIARGQDDNCPCCTDDHKAFDFWLGSWEVTNTDGSAAGKNTIVKDLNNCILRENWTSASAGFTGTSTNFFNKSTEQWEQLWIDNSGNHLKLRGQRQGNQMILASEEFMRPDGKAYVNRITWTANDDGTVRQLWEVLQNEKVVNIAFDGLYSKVE